MKIGAHQSVSGGYAKAIERIINIGGNCLQIFASSPRGWNFAKPKDEEIDLFVKEKIKNKIDPVYFHASYLVNLADDGRTGHLSKLSLISELNLAPRMQVKGSIVHLGSFKGDKTDLKYKTLITNLKEIISKTPSQSLLMIENAGNNKIGQTIEEISSIIKDVDSPRVKVCLDTCHLYSAGYDLSTIGKYNDFFSKFEKLIGVSRLELFHFNDSRDPFASGHDRHENIGVGTIPIEEFKIIMAQKKTKELAFIIETPGFADAGPDKQNLDILKGLI